MQCSKMTMISVICIQKVIKFVYQMCYKKTKIIVNEQGTEAASGTVSASRGMNMEEPVVFKASDRPFIYMITVHSYDTEEVLL